MDTVTLWTRQSPRALAELYRTGSYRCSSRDMEERYSEFAFCCEKIYRWYTNTAKDYIQVPENCDFPFWLAPEPERLGGSIGPQALIRLEIPRNQVLPCNLAALEYRMSSRYIPCSLSDDQQHQQELQHWGVPSDWDLINTHLGNFYPHLRRKIQDSWKRVFTQLTVAPEMTALTTWELRKEWIREVRIDISETIPTSP